MGNRRRIVGAVMVAMVVLAGTPSSTVFAQEQPTEATRGITVLPPNVTLDADRGAQIQRNVAVENSTTVQQDIQVSIRNFKPEGEDGAAAPTDEDSSYSMARWIDTDVDRFSLQPGERRDLIVAIDVPGDAEPGSHFGSVIFTPSSPQDATGAFSVTTEVAALFLLRVPGDAKQEASVQSFEALIRDNKGPVGFTTKLQNTGSVHFVPQGQITITDTFGRDVATIPVNTESRPVLPGAVRRFDSSWDEGLLLGRYTAKLELTYPDNVTGQSPRTLSSEATFWALPPLLVGAAVLAIVLLIALIALSIRRRRKARSQSGG